LDCPAGIEQGFENAIAGASRALIVTTPEVSAIRDADRIIGLLEAHGIKKNELIINRLRVDMVRRGDMMSVEDVTEILAIPLLGVIPDDEQVVIATNQGEPIVGCDCLSGQAYLEVCKRILGEEIPINDFSKVEGLFARFSNFFRRG
jgi:septum site-determining protein MinD